VAEDDGITGLSLNGVRKLIEDRSLPEDILDAFSLVSGAVIALAPVYLGPSGAALWPLLEPKNALIDAAKAAIVKLTRPQPRDYVDQVRRFAAANTLLTYTAFFDALPMCKKDFMQALRLTENEKARIAARAAEQALGAPQLPDARPLADIIKVQHPAAVDDLAAAEFRREVYLGMAKGIFDRIEFLAERDRIIHADPVNALAEHVAALAESVYQAEFLGIAIEYHPFSVWAMLQDRADKAALLRKLSTDLRAADEDSQLRFELLGAALHSLDLGLDRLSRAIAAQPLSSPDGPRYPESKAARAAEALGRRYAADVERPVIDDRYDPPTGGPRLKYPGSAAAYVPQAYRQVRYAVGETHLERDEEWTKLPAANDLGPAITRYLESPYSAESPLLILGHPGSGKSLLTRVYAARLQYPRYTVVRVELRDADPTVSIQKQVEDQIRKDTGYDVNWADLADNLPLSPPIVILDGYDELLQATGRLFTDYLDQVQRFQRDALIQNRPVRVIVTSRITLIDKAIIPPGTTVMRLAPFDESRRTEWISRWNQCNAEYFRQPGAKPFRLPDNPKVVDLAEQPLLLLMLAIFDSAANPLSERPDLDQTLLYDELLRRFIERELGKGEHGAALSGLPPEERRPLVDRELNRLGVAAIGMFNRQEVKILRDQLDKDLAYFGAERPAPSGLYGQTQSEILLGSFFFIHESRSRLAINGTANRTQQPEVSGKPALATGPTAFEFLHNTFGEYLAADFILKQVIENAETIRDLTGKPSLEHARQQHLTSLTPHWWACLLYTSLHTRPNILTLLREWSLHRLPADTSARAELLSYLNDIIRMQLRTVLAGTDPLDLAARARSVAPSEPTPTPPPYDPLPVLGHVAVYTLNMILLRTYLADQMYTLDEPALDAGDRPWDRLTALWRSWFSPESLGTLATQFTATRMDDQLMLAPHLSELIVGLDSPLDTAYNTAIALADNLAAASFGLHVASLWTFPEDSFTALLERFSGEAPTLIPIAEAMRSRLYGSAGHRLPDYAYRALKDVADNAPEFMLRFAELIGRATTAPGRRSQIWLDSSDLRTAARLPRYQAELLVHAIMRFDPEWVRAFIRSIGISRSDLPQTWRSFLMRPAAAPVLRAAIQELAADQCTTFAEVVLSGLAREELELFDADTAAGLAVLAWRGSVLELCLRAIDKILLECGRGAWLLMDIPMEVWPGLTDALLTAESAVQDRRRRLSSMLDDELAEAGVEDPGDGSYLGIQLIEFYLQALRVGVSRHRARLLKIVAGGAVSLETRQFLLLVRWARENGETRLAADMLSGTGDYAATWWTSFGALEEEGPEAIDLDRASADLTYREAMDLRWALDLWRESGAHWPGDPTDPRGYDPARPPVAPRAKRRRSRR
jgi:hypothetical protein